MPQFKVPPQPSPVVPQFFPCAAQVLGWQQTFEDRQTWPAGQVPHESDPPQPSEAVPQFSPEAAQVVGLQLFGTCDFKFPSWS